MYIRRLSMVVCSLDLNYCLAGAWFGILTVVSQLAVVTNAFLIAITAQFIPIETYARGGFRSVGSSP